MRRQVLVIWTAVTLLSVVDVLLCHRLGLRFYDWSRLALAAGVTAGIALLYQISGRSTHLARAAHWTLLWLIFVDAGTVLTYITAACGGRPDDATLAAIGFDWTGWYSFLAPPVAWRLVL